MTADRWLRVLTLSIAITLTVAACGPSAAPAPSAAATSSTAASAAPTTAAAPSAIDRVKSKGLYVAVFSSAPLSFLDGSNWVGSLAEESRYCAQDKFGIGDDKIYPVFLPIAGLFPGLQAKRFDVVVGPTINPTRLQVAIATQHMHTWGARPIFKTGDALANQIHSWTDIAKSGQELALAAGVNEIAEAQKRNIPVKTYQTLDLAVADLLAGRVRMVLHGDLAIPGVKAQTNNGIVEADPFDYEGIQSGAAFWTNPDEKDLRDVLNDCVTQMKNNGKLKEILTKWKIPLVIPPVGPGQP